MRIPVGGAAVGALVVAGGVAAFALNAGAAGAAAPTKVHLVAASASIQAADQAALTYVDQHFPGAGTAAVLKTEADTERGVAVFDVSVKAPNGSTYSLAVRASDYSVISASLAESSATPTPLGTLQPSKDLSPEPKQTPEAQQTPEPKQTPEANSSSPDSSTGSSGASQDSQDQQSTATGAGQDS